MEHEIIESPLQKERHGKLYYLFRNIRRGIRNRLKNNRKKFLTTLVIILGAIVGLRGLWQPELIWMRNHLWVVLALGALYIATRLLKKIFSGRLASAIITALALLLVTGYLYASHNGFDIHEYLSLYLRYKTLDIVELNKMPFTDHERTQPRRSIFTQAKTKLPDNLNFNLPHYTRVGNQYNWTMSIEPPTGLGQLWGNTEGVLNIAGEDPSPSFAGDDSLVLASFETGELLKLGKNVFTNTIKTFLSWRFLSYQPAEMFPTMDDEGNWVQVVMLIRWNGILFPWPEFGGVHIIPSADRLSLFDKVRLWVLGIGKWIPPGDIPKYPFLKGQSIVPAEVQRFNANSFRFHSGFWAPAPFYHRGDVRIPDLPEDVNDQPFTTFFRFPASPDRSKLYDYFSLEPYDPTKRGLNTSMLCPGDGQGPIFVRKHYLFGERMTGVSAAASKIQDTRKNYTWQSVKPVEFRSYIKMINGEQRFFWLTTVVTVDEKNKKDFLTGSTPELAVVDADTDDVFWLHSGPNTWVRQIEQQLAEKKKKGD